MTEIVILASPRPYIWPFWVHFPALKTQTYRNGSSKTPKMAYRRKITTCTGYIYGFVGLLNEYFTQNDWNRDFSLSDNLYLTLLGTFSSP